MLSIKIKIAEREYPMRAPIEEEEILRKAGKELNNKLKELQKAFGLDDKQDLLAMIAFDLLVKQGKQEVKEDNGLSPELMEKLSEISKEVKDAL